MKYNYLKIKKFIRKKTNSENKQNKQTNWSVLPKVYDFFLLQCIKTYGHLVKEQSELTNLLNSLWKGSILSLDMCLWIYLFSLLFRRFDW